MNLFNFCKNKMMCMIRSAYFDFVVYTILMISTVFINKYVLSVLKFTYPTVFQAWQTLISAVILKFLSMRKNLDVSFLDKTSATHLLPHCVFFVGAIVAGSKALSRLPISVFLAAGNVPAACAALLDGGASAAGTWWETRVGAAALVVGAGVSAALLDAAASASAFADSGYSWLLAHVAFLTAQLLHARLTDPRLSDVDKIYYSNIFSVVILAPTSLYMEEALAALHFAQRRQLRFAAACLCSGTLGALLQLRGTRARQRWGRRNSQAHALARLAAATLATLAHALFPTYALSSTTTTLLALSLLAAPLVPSPPLPDDPEPPYPEDAAAKSLLLAL